MISAEDLPVFALQDDRVVEVVGDPAGVHKAVELIPIFEMCVRKWFSPPEQ